MNKLDQRSTGTASCLRQLYLIVRSLLLWIASIVHFFPICTLLVILGIFVDPRKNDRPQRWFFRNILRVAGVGFEVKYAPGFDRTRTSLFICNHVNLFDAFVIYSAIPQFVRGLELESHFKIPAYGWMMKRFGNVPVPKDSSPAGLKKMIRQAQAALDNGVSLIVFAEGTRTTDGRVGPFKKGAFILAQQTGYPIVPMSIVGSYEFNRKGSWMLYPSKIVVYIHDTIETTGMTKHEIDALVERVHRIVSRPVDQAMGIESEIV
ncbi:MAG: lysophospholipid acyltransferase family protein [Acidobacteriota bacterium]|nr:1-acyl-sn-glycerol-3-phosphate acyltransferase [Blastocatellia bacterium]MDW8240826.1 lysophospholipid acyltransferase family protein [Acidobacteriota bacterium]